MPLPVIRKTLRLYTPHPGQLRFHNCKARFRVLKNGRQWGKSTCCLNELLSKGWVKPNQTLWFISPTYDSATIMFRRTMRALTGIDPDPDNLLAKDNKAELRVSLENGTNIFFKSGQVLENLRSETLHGVIIDEVRNQHKDLWKMVIRPMLATTKGWAVFISTPNGFDHFEELYTRALLDKTGRWAALSGPSTENPLITEDELDDARATMTADEFAQEYLAEFRDLTSGRAYVSFSLERNVRDFNPFYPQGIVHPGLPTVVGLDFNVYPMAWSLSQKKVDDFYGFDEIFLKNTHTAEAAKVLVEKLLPLPNLKHGVILVGDSTGESRKTSAAGQTDYSIVCQALDEAKIKWVNMTPDSNPPVKDRINTMNAKLLNAKGESHMWVHSRCIETIKDFQRVVWKENANGSILDQKKDRERTHITDAFGYPVCALSPLVYKKGTTRMSVINAPSI